MAQFINFNPSDFFNPYIYTGTGVAIGSGGTAFTGVGFQGDLWWGKQRNGTYRQQSYDSVRGVEKYLAPNTTEAQSATDTEGFSAWSSDGFTLGDRAQSNVSAGTFVCWNWKMGTTSGIAGSPSITPSSYSFNASSGQSIIAYTGNGTAGATIPHGLGVAPDFIMVKKTSSTSDWFIYHSKMDATAPQDYYLSLNGNAARTNNNGEWHDTAPTSTLVTLGANTTTNTATFIAYCFASIKGYSKFGTYYGRATTNNVFVYTGFRPAFFMVKNRDTTDNWMMQDNKRIGFNASNWKLQPNTTAVEDETNYIDFLSNGFKVRNAHSGIGSASNFVYMAFAENPLVGSNETPGLGR